MEKNYSPYSNNLFLQLQRINIRTTSYLPQFNFSIGLLLEINKFLWKGGEKHVQKY